MTEPPSSSVPHAESSSVPPATLPPASPSADDDLPEWEPLSPEIVEDEAIRGDFMLRWAIVLLAFLLGCRVVTETAALVHIRSGEQIARHWFWPSSNDALSFTAGDATWSNTSWLFDVLLAGVYGIGGAAGLSVFCGLVSAWIVWLIQRTARPLIPTWWTTCCAAAALMMLQLQLTPLPELITLLGSAWMLRGLVAWSQTGTRMLLVCLVVSLAVWSNLDPRAFIGWLLLLGFTLGCRLGQGFGWRWHHADACLKDLRRATRWGLVALLVNPFWWRTLYAPIQLYGTDIPALLSYASGQLNAGELQLLSLVDLYFWRNLNLYTIAALAVAGLAVITGLLNIRRLDLGLLGALLAATALAVLCAHELGVFVIVAAVACGVHAQDWYRFNCRQTYSTATLEVLWSRGGRAVTVIALAAVAWLGISGRMTGPDEKRVGIGFSPLLASVIDGMGRDLQELGEGHIFTLRPDHGDLLIWHGRKSFVDSRLGLFTASGGDEGQGDSVLIQHDQARHGLRSRRPDAEPIADDAALPLPVRRSAWLGQPDFWRDTFQRFKVRYVMPRMWGQQPDYDTYVELVRSSDWRLAAPGFVSAAFEQRVTGMNPLLAADVRFSDIAFKQCRKPEIDVLRPEWPRPASSYQRLLSVPSDADSIFTIRARHEINHLQFGTQGLLPIDLANALGLATLGVRDAQAGVAANPDSAAAYRVLSRAFETIGELENAILAEAGIPLQWEPRMYQSRHALRQAMLLEPDNVNDLTRAAEDYYATGRIDLAHEMIDLAMDLYRLQPPETPEGREQIRRLNEVRLQLKERLVQVNQRIESALAEPDSDRIAVAAAAQQAGCPALALAVLEDDPTLIAGSPVATQLQAILLVECSRLTDAQDALERLSGTGDELVFSLSLARQLAWLDIVRGDYSRAIALLQKRLSSMEMAGVDGLISLAPFTMSPPKINNVNTDWPATQTLIASRVLYNVRAEVSALRYSIATAQVESGQCEQATETFRDLVKAEPDSPLRPLVRVWLQALAGEQLPVSPAAELAPPLTDGPPEIEAASPQE